MCSVVLPINTTEKKAAIGGTQYGWNVDSITTSSARKPIPPEILCRRLSNQLSTRTEPPRPASAPQNIKARITSRSLETPNKKADFGFFPSALSFRPQKVPRNVTTTTPKAIIARSSESGLNRDSPNRGSKEISANGTVPRNEPPSGGC